MDNREQELFELSNQIAEKLSALPDDGNPRQITVTQTGDGTVVLGSQVIINPPMPRDIPDHERPTAWLREAMTENKRQINAARGRKWLSVPSVVIHLVLLGFALYVAFAILSALTHRDFTLLLQSAEVVAKQPVYIATFGVALSLFGFWHARIRKVEDRIIAESQANIEYISTILKRRNA